MAQALEELVEGPEEFLNEDFYGEALFGEEGDEPDDHDFEIFDHEGEPENNDFLLDEELDGIFGEGYNDEFEYEFNEEDLAQIGDVQDHAHEYQVQDPINFEEYQEHIEPLGPGEIPELGEVGLGNDELEALPDNLTRNDQVREVIPNFVREMNISREEALKDLELLEKLDSNIDHVEVKDDERRRRKEAAKKLYREKKRFLEHIQETYEVSPFIVGAAPAIESEMGLSTEEFVHIFNGGDSSRVIGEGFHSQGVVGGQYDQGVEKLESLSRKEGKFETDIDYENTVRRALGEELFNDLDLKDKIREAKMGDRDVEAAILEDEFNQLIGELMQEDPEKGQEMIDKRNELKAEINEEKRTEALKYAMKTGISDPEIGEKAYRQIMESENPDLGFLRQDNVESMLDSLAEEHLSDDCSAYHEAKRLADNMDGREVEFELYDKSFENMPYKENRNLPCTFPGSSHAKSVAFTSYMLDPATQVGKIETDKGDGVALMKLVEYEGDGFLYVHSVEADKGENIASNKEMAREIKNQIEKYAEEISQYSFEVDDDREIEMEGIMYCMSRHNHGTASSFQSALRDYEDPEIETKELEHAGVRHQGFDHNIETGVRVYEKNLG